MKRKLEKIYKPVYSEDILCISLLSEHSTTTSPSSHSTPRWCSRAGSSLSACPAPRPGPWRRSSRMKESTSRAGGPSSSEVTLYSIHTCLLQCHSVTLAQLSGPTSNTLLQALIQVTEQSYCKEKFKQFSNGNTSHF